MHLLSLACVLIIFDRGEVFYRAVRLAAIAIHNFQGLDRPIARAWLRRVYNSSSMSCKAIGQRFLVCKRALLTDQEESYLKCRVDENFPAGHFNNGIHREYIPLEEI